MFFFKMANIALSNSAKLLGLSRNTIRCLSSHILQQEHKNIIHSDYPDIHIPNMTIPEFIFDKTASYGKKVAFECSETGRKYTYDDCIFKARNFSKALRKKCGLQRGDVVAILLPNIPEFNIAVLGTLAGGLIATTLNPSYTPDEISRQIKDSNAKILITIRELYPVAKTAVGNSMQIIHIRHKPDTSVGQGGINFTELTDSVIDFPETVDISTHDVALLPYSSGTTGMPKGVCLSHRNILSNIKQFTYSEMNIFNCNGMGDSTTTLPAILPFFHIFGYTIVACGGMAEAAKILTLSQFQPDLYAKVLLEHKPAILLLAPPIITFLNNHPMITQKHLQSIQIVMSGAAPLGSLDIEKLMGKAQTDVKVLQGYGLTESSPAIFLQPYQGNTPHGSSGKILPNISVQIMPIDDPNGEPLGPNQPGEAYVKGSNIMMRYHNRPKETAETLIDGWLRTGDILHYDENRNFFVTDRIKELIKVKGFQVPPAELEELIRGHPDVADAAVIGIPHEICGEVPRAFVVPMENGAFDSNSLHEYINSKVAKFKRLEGGIEIVPSIPKNAAGKILRRVLRDQYSTGN